MNQFNTPILLAKARNPTHRWDSFESDQFHLYCVKCAARLSTRKTSGHNLPERHELYCDQCGKSINEWVIAAITESDWNHLKSVFDEKERKEYLSAMAQSTWSRKLHHGGYWREGTHSLDSEAFINARKETADWLGVPWKPTCPLCYKQVESPDFHHWRYDNEVGVSVCRSCHNVIHRHNTVSIQKELADELGADCWQELAVRNTAGRYNKNTDSDRVYIKHFIYDMNIPFSDAVVSKWSRPAFERRGLEVLVDE